MSVQAIRNELADMRSRLRKLLSGHGLALAFKKDELRDLAERSIAATEHLLSHVERQDSRINALEGKEHS